MAIRELIQEEYNNILFEGIISNIGQIASWKVKKVYKAIQDRIQGKVDAIKVEQKLQQMSHQQRQELLKTSIENVEEFYDTVKNDKKKAYQSIISAVAGSVLFTGLMTIPMGTPVLTSTLVVLGNLIYIITNIITINQDAKDIGKTNKQLSYFSETVIGENKMNIKNLIKEEIKEQKLRQLIRTQILKEMNGDDYMDMENDRHQQKFNDMEDELSTVFGIPATEEPAGTVHLRFPDGKGFVSWTQDNNTIGGVIPKKFKPKVDKLIQIHGFNYGKTMYY